MPKRTFKGGCVVVVFDGCEHVFPEVGVHLSSPLHSHKEKKVIISTVTKKQR